ncbi:putative nucleotidyltransferase [Ereboglobus sp. PH5-5]|nr:putative nucleotidyltransferase [Ereboglobus sp. PH5-10]MDF9833923.1 putative nucleotidyltransferase [Ereboglobus sp. PH5-5]
MEDLSILLKRLNDEGVDFVIIGGFAAVAYGASTLTRDVDLCAALTRENVERIRAALSGWNPRHRMTPARLSFLTHPSAGEDVKNLYLETDKGVVDILSSVIGVGDFERLRRAAEVVEIDGCEYRIMGLADLIASKEALGRDKDLLAARELRVIEEKRKS